MKPEYELISEKPEKSFTAKLVSRKSRPLLSQAWHYHPEIEICFTEKGNGKRFVGNNIVHYEDKDLVLLGSNLPHGFTTSRYCNQIVIQLNKNFLGDQFFSKPELRLVNDMIEKSKRGLAFIDQTNKKAEEVIKQIMNTEGFLQMIKLLELLNLLSTSKDAVPICSEEYGMDFNPNHFKRIKIVYKFLLENYQRQLSVKEVADTINLTEVAFYKFIKKHTKKTFTQIINEFRINHASKLLSNSDATIAEICFNSGYNNISYFNRKFKEIMGKTPMQFRGNYK